jgi:hypothetical protein
VIGAGAKRWTILVGAKIYDNFPFTTDIHGVVFRHVEMVVSLCNKNVKSKDHAEISVDVEDYYRIKVFKITQQKRGGFLLQPPHPI